MIATAVHKQCRQQNPTDLTLFRWLAIALAVMVVPALGGCLSRGSGAVPLPYVKPANSVPAPSPTVPMQMASRMQAMETELQRLWDTVERMNAAGGNQETVAKLQERIAFIEKQLGIDPVVQTKPEGAPAAAIPPAVPPQATGTDGAPGAFPPVAAAGPPRSSTPVQIQNPPVASDRQDYRDAYAAFRSGAHAKALELLDAFLKNYPKSDLVPSALYCAGEAHFAMKHFEDAVLYFDRVIKEYPGSNKELSALLKQGQSFEKMGDVRSARIIFQKLVSEHPHTPQARLAAGRLKSLPAPTGTQS